MSHIKETGTEALLTTMQAAAAVALECWNWIQADPNYRFALNVLIAALCIWSLLEIVFFLVVYFLLLPQLNKSSKPLPYLAERKQFILRILGTVDRLQSYDFKKYVSGFCCGAKFDDVRVDNFCSFLAWAMFNKRLRDLNKQQHDLVYSTFATSCERHPELRELKPGYNPQVKHVAMNLSKLPYIHRPLLMYVMVGITEMMSNLLLLRACGFQCLEVNGMTYWYKQSKNINHHDEGNAQKADPVMFMHGISPGWSFYMGIVRALAQHRDIFLVDLDAIKIKSMKFFMPSPQQYADTVRLILERHRIPTVSLIGHSFGTICANWVIIRYPELVSHLTLIDPVSMLLAFPDVAFNFIYRQPANVAQWVIYLGASTELTISHMLHRQFWWYQNILWLEDIPPHIGVVVGLASDDQICNPQVVQEYVEQCSIRRQQLAQQQAQLPGFTTPITNILRDDAPQQDSPGAEIHPTSASTLAVVCKPAVAASPKLPNQRSSRRRRGGRHRKRSSSKSSDSSSVCSNDSGFSSIASVGSRSRDDEDDVAVRRSVGLLQKVSGFTSSMISSYYHNNSARGRNRKLKMRKMGNKSSRSKRHSDAAIAAESSQDDSMSRVSSFSSLALSRASSMTSFGSCASLASLADKSGLNIPQNADAVTAMEELRRQYGLPASISSAARCGGERTPSEVGSQKVASIRCVMWEGFVHGQVLVAMETLNSLLHTIFQNEKVAKS